MSSLLSITFYITTLTLSSLFLHYGKKRRIKLLIVLSLLLPILLSSFRYNVGTDYQSYINIYNNLWYRDRVFLHHKIIKNIF